uniref:HORMA domain-containing protein n=1 Tax=Angiostrongylus cantonensis TaxID=6313 RepID=A0A0K0DLG4_ANGCA
LKSLSRLCSCALNPLPVGASAAMRITYTNRTPKGYQAPGFYRSPEDPVLLRHAHCLKLGLFQTKYHRASVRVRSAFLNCEDITKLSFNEGIELYNLDGADGGAHRSVNSNSVKRMSSGRPLQQNETVEAVDEDVVFIGETRARSSFGIPGWDPSEITRPNFDSSDRRSFAEDYPRRLRRGRHTLTKRPRGQSAHGRFGGPASATPQVVNASTAQSKERDIVSDEKFPGLCFYMFISRYGFFLLRLVGHNQPGKLVSAQAVNCFYVIFVLTITVQYRGCVIRQSLEKGFFVRHPNSC